MAGEIRGPVRFRFRMPDEDVDVRVEGDHAWVQTVREDLGLTDVGWLQPLASNIRYKEQTAASAVARNGSGEAGADDANTLAEPAPPKDMGPPPDPSRIPVVRRPIGSLDLVAELVKLGLEPPQRPTPQQLAMELEGIEEPDPAQGPLVTDPMAEAWLKELMRLAVRTHGLTALALDAIEQAASSLLGNRSGMELELWLENLFRQGKLVKIHGGDRVGYGPSPAWLDGRRL